MDQFARTGDKIVIINAEKQGSGSAAVAGFEYQIGVSIWLALDLILASKLTQEMILEPASQEDLEAEIEDYAPGRVTSSIAMDVPNARWKKCLKNLHEEALNRILGGGSGRLRRSELEGGPPRRVRT